MFDENLPAWIVAMNPFSNNIVLSGGDDMCLKFWDLRCFSSPTEVKSKVYEAGVTSAMFSPHHEYLVAVGSYDETIRLWDMRAMKLSVNTVETG